MNSKITLPDLIAALSQSSGRPRSVCERFIKTMFATIADTLASGDNVKIKGLGTFKVSDVEERKSVNVNTGAEMIIPGHRKVSFNPDKNLAELINAPFALFEAVELDEEVSEEMLAAANDEVSAPHQSEQEERVAETEIKESPVIKQPEATDTEELADEEPQDPWQEAVEEQFSEPTQSMTSASEDKNTEESGCTTSEDTVAEPSHEMQKEIGNDKEVFTDSGELETTPPETSPQIHTSTEATRDEEIYEDNKKVEIHVHSPECHAPHFRKGVYIGIAVAAFAMVALVVAWRILLPDSFCKVTDTVLPATHNELIAHTATPATPAADTISNTDTLPDSQRIQPVETTIKEDPAPTQASDVAETKEEVKPSKVYDTITKKRFLTTMAKEHYGDYNLWPYIYDENKAILGHPDRIKPGTKVIIPPAEKYGIDAHNPDCVARAKRRGAEIYAKYKN